MGKGDFSLNYFSIQKWRYHLPEHAGLGIVTAVLTVIRV